jgi:RNA polymerase subunit RPABC4/transcription elongation factor Spt4
MVYRNCPRCAAVLDGLRVCPKCGYKLRGRKPKSEQPVVVKPEQLRPASTAETGSGPGPIAPARGPGPLPFAWPTHVTVTIAVDVDLSKAEALESLRIFLREVSV